MNADLEARARLAGCGHCGADPLEECWPGLHVARLAAAYKAGLVTEAEFFAALDGVTVFTSGTVIPARAGSEVAA